MELQFVKQGGRYIAEFQTTGDFNLHIEREESGYLYVRQRTTDTGKYDSIRGASFNYGDPVVDVDFTGVLYPKYIQVVSKVEPTYAEVTSNGEVVQIGGIKKVRINIFDGVVKEYEYEDGMTWADWVDSEYSMGEWENTTKKIVHKETVSRLYYSNDQQVSPSDKIKETEEYTAKEIPE